MIRGFFKYRGKDFGKHNEFYVFLPLFFASVFLFLPGKIVAQQSFDNSLFWTQKKMIRTDMPLWINGIYFGSDLAKNMIYNSPVFNDLYTEYKPFTNPNLFGTEGSQGNLIFSEKFFNEKSIKLNFSSLGEMMAVGKARVVIKNHHVLYLSGNTYNQSFSIDKNRDKALDMPYRQFSKAGLNYEFSFLQNVLYIRAFTLINNDRNGQTGERKLGEKYQTGEVLSPFISRQNQNLVAGQIGIISHLNTNGFGLLSHSMENSLQVKNYNESSVWAINPYQAYQTTVALGSSWSGKFLRGYSMKGLANLRYNNVHENLNGLVFDKKEKNVGAALELDKTFNKELRKRMASYSNQWKYQLHAQWRIDHNSIYGWINTPNIRLNRQWNHILAGLIYERNNRMPNTISENRDLLMGNRKISIQKDKTLETSNKIGFAIENKTLYHDQWKWVVTCFYVQYKNKWVAEVNNEANELYLYSVKGKANDRQVQIQLKGPARNQKIMINATYRFDDIRNAENKPILLTPKHTGILNLKYKLPYQSDYYHPVKSLFNGLTANFTQYVIGSQRLPDNKGSEWFFISNFNVEFSEQIFYRRYLSENSKHFLFSVGWDNFLNQKQSTLLIKNDNSNLFNGLNSYGPTAGRRFVFSIKYNL